ncbi:hypothetical protein TNCV_1187471 [Trichonephila clavipes]|nr:hypothetical protein TNCV_1187471 [Trichonephila clavipes]
MDSWLESHEFEPSTTDNPPCREEAIYVTSVEAQISSCLCGVEVRRGAPELRYLPRHLTMPQNFEIQCLKPSSS